MKTLIYRRGGILSFLLVAVGLFSRLILAVEDVKPKKFVLKGYIQAEAKKGDEVQLESTIDTIYEERLHRGLKSNTTVQVCGYTLYGESQLFKVLVNKETGEGKVIILKDLSHVKDLKKNYTFDVAPHVCTSGRHLEKTSIHVEVTPTYKWKPQWKRSSYFIEAAEGNFYSSLLKVEVKDESEDNGVKGHVKVCKFMITTAGVPFEVDETGNITNSEPLDVSRKEKWVFEVVAVSCDKRSSDPLKVTIKVKPSCQVEWVGIPERIEFSPHDGKRLLAPEAELDLCDNTCNISLTTVSINLSTIHIGKGCDRDTYSLHSQRRLCGASAEAIDLLPSPTLAGSWTKDLTTDDGKESDEVFAFDGKKDAVEIPENVGKIKLGREFTIATWMKHDEMDEKDDGSIPHKENILCMSDAEEMNRPHMALFLRHCHLVLLLRQEPDSGLDRDSYAPAEWRWTLPEACDGKWHHYAISISNEEVVEPEQGAPTAKPVPPSPKAKLYVDGNVFIETRKNPNMVNDFPLHPSKNIHSIKIVVGGCWMGGMGRIGHHFKGYLAGLSLLNNQNEPDRVIQCLTKCQEKLDFSAIDEMDTGMTLSMNREMTSITIGGPSLPKVENLLRKVGYINSRNFPTPGIRPVTFETRAVCKDGKQVDVEAVKSLLIVGRVEKAMIVLKGMTRFEQETDHLITGVPIFKGLDISTHSKSQADEIGYGNNGKKPEFMSKYKLDSCTIKMNIPLAPHVEQLRLPENLIKQLELKVESSADGVTFSGVDKLENYEAVLSGVRYVNKRPSDLNLRTFALVCTELNGRYVSNKLEVSMSVVHKMEEKEDEPQAANVHRLVQPINSILPSNDKQSIQPRMKTIIMEQPSSGSATGVVIVCVVCIGFIVLLAAVGVSRIRNAQRHSRDAGVDDKQEMEWDNSALTITVNPMDQEGLYDDDASLVSVLNNNNNDTDDEKVNNRHHHHHHRHHNDNDDTDADDDDVSCHDSSCVDDDEEEEDVQGKVKKGELEWDDSTLNY